VSFPATESLDNNIVLISLRLSDTIIGSLSRVYSDEFCRAPEKVTDYRTLVSGVRPKDLKDAQPFEALRKKVKQVLDGKVLVGHGLSNDLKCLKINHPAVDIRDTGNDLEILQIA
jgi:RNA exonuclease 4